MTRIASGIIGVAVACVCSDAGAAVDIDRLAMLTGSYINQAMACKADEWKLALRESIKHIQKWDPASDLRYFQLVVEWANRYEVRDCDQTKLLTTRRVQRAYLDSFTRDPGPRCKLCLRPPTGRPQNGGRLRNRHPARRAVKH